nr:hypothetical protein GW17_00041600 [Ipomoea batatas]
MQWLKEHDNAIPPTWEQIFPSVDAWLNAVKAPCTTFRNLLSGNTHHGFKMAELTGHKSRILFMAQMVAQFLQQEIEHSDFGMFFGTPEVKNRL